MTEALTEWGQPAAGHPELLPASSISRREAVVNQIRRGIVLGVLRPGEKLTEVGLATALQVSRPTVREAMAQLAQEGLLTAEPYRGLRVTEIDAAAIRDLAQTRPQVLDCTHSLSLDSRPGRDFLGLNRGIRTDSVGATES